MKHYVLGHRNGLITSPKPAVKRISWAMGFATLTCAAAIFIAYLGFEESSGDAQVQQRHSKLDKAALVGSVTSKATPSVWGGKGCSGGSLNPFANRMECDSTVQSQTSTEQASNAQDMATHRRTMIRNAIGGDVSQFESYRQYSRNCRKQPEAISEENADCETASLKANDALFVMVAEKLAARGNTQAQLALGQWWLEVATFPSAPQPAGTDDLARETDETSKQPEAVTALRESAYFFSQAAPQSLQARMALEHLASIGVSAPAVAIQ